MTGKIAEIVAGIFMLSQLSKLYPGSSKSKTTNSSLKRSKKCNLSFAETSEVWNASAQDIDINSADATFAGAFDDVTVTDAAGTVDGSGDLGGFFSGDDSGQINGAGMSFTLNEGGTEVNGSAAFQVAPGSD